MPFALNTIPVKNMSYRTEHDILGTKEIPDSVYYGIHTARALENFPVSGYRINPVFIHALGLVKKACLLTNHELGYIKEELFGVILQATDEVIANTLDEHIVVDPLQGGAGTSTNMNINEVIANRALEIGGKPKGDYKYIHPLRHINLHQSTNDVYPTAIKVAGLILLNDAERIISELQNQLQNKEKQFAHIPKTGRTQLQDAVPLTLGRTFSAFADAIGRDRWRVFKSRERLRVVNLGGTMIGTGISAPRDYIFLVTEKLRDITGLNISRSENLIDATQNHDPFVEVSAIMKAHAVNLRKMCSDLRYLSSGPRTGLGEISLAPLQAGSSVMPGKVNPVIPEMVEQCAVKIIANDLIVAETASRGELELNAFLPLLNFAFIESLQLVIKADEILIEKCIKKIEANKNVCRHNLKRSFGVLTGLLPIFGYETVEKIAYSAHKTGRDPVVIIEEMGLMNKDEIKRFLSAENFSRLGFEPPKVRGN